LRLTKKFVFRQKKPESYSNPTTYPMKETSFVYQGRRGFFLHFGQKSSKYGQNRDQIGLRSGIAAVPEPNFCVSGAK